MNKIITPERTAHLYALMAWNDAYTKEEAENIAYTLEYEKLNEKTWAETSITAAIQGIKDKFLNEQETNEIINWSDIKLEANIKTYMSVIEILDDIHNKWVLENAKKFNRGSEEKSNKNLFQHLPTAMIGIEEVAKDLVFLAPILKEMGIHSGEMQLTAYGAFKPSTEIIIAYNKYVQNYIVKNNIFTTDDLNNHIEKCINGDYTALNPTSDIGKERIEYMKKHINLLSNSVINKNESVFGVLNSLDIEL